MAWKSEKRRAVERQLGLRQPPGTSVPAEAIDKLRLAMQGAVVLPSDPTYDAARQASNHAFQSWPLLIAYCEVPSDVAACLALAREHDVWVVCRSGGHSTAGFSVNTGVVIDLSRFRYVTVDRHARRAVVGAGTNFGHLNAVLDTYGLHVPSGGCEDVCVGGFVQGGGYGFTSRAFGMSCDNIVSALVVLADGRLVEASYDVNPDLFWALRGGTGNNFGVLLEVTYALHELPEVWGFGLKWGAEHAAEALAEMQRSCMRSAPPAVGYMSFLAVDEGHPILMMRGMCTTGREAGMAALHRLRQTTGVTMDVDRVDSYFNLNRYLLEWPREIPEVPDLGREDKQSGYVDQPLSREQWQIVIDAFLATPNPWTTVVFEPYGGAIEAVAATESAFVHRHVDLDLFVDVFWMNDEEEIVARRYLDETMDRFAPLLNGHSYQNYPRRNTADYRWRFWGGSFDTLLAVKQKYDPTGFFHFAQDISPPEVPEPRLGEGGPDLSHWLAEPIVAIERAGS